MKEFFYLCLIQSFKIFISINPFVKIMKIFSFLFLSFVIMSCGSSEEDKNFKTESSHVKNNCIPPNLKLDVDINRKFCGSDDCLIKFKDYWWWTNYQFTGDPNWFWNKGQAWSPRNTFADGEGLHLFVRKDDLGGGPEWMASEVVAVYLSDKKTLAKTGYGTYLVSAKIKSASSWDKLDKNVAFGLFTFQKDASGGINNPHRELDLAEISRWGTPPCSNAFDSRLCEGNAQFGIQKWDKNRANLQRYSIQEGVNEITLVMKWKSSNAPVTFLQFNGTYTLDNLPASPTNSYITSSSQNTFIPNDDCQLFHMNLWMGNFGEGDKHPGPADGQPQEVVITNFQYIP